MIFHATRVSVDVLKGHFINTSISIVSMVIGHIEARRDTDQNLG